MIFHLIFHIFCHGWGKLLTTRSRIKAFNCLKCFFNASGFFLKFITFLIPPLLLAGAPDATGPSLSGGQTPSPGRRVSGLGGPELVRPMLLLQLRRSIS